MVAHTTPARSQDDLARARPPRTLVALQSTHGIIRTRTEGGGEQTAVLDRLTRALPEVREHRVRGIAEHGDPTARPALDRVAVVERPLVPDLSRREDPQQRLVPSAVALEHLAALALGDPRFVPVVLVVVVADDVDQLVSTHRIEHDRPVWTEPLDVVVRGRPTRDRVDRNHAAVTDLAGEPWRIRTE